MLIRQFGFELVNELSGGASRAPGVPAVPQEGALPQMLRRYGQAAPAGESGYDLQVACLVGGGEGKAQPEAGRKGELLLHGVAGVYVVAYEPSPRSEKLSRIRFLRLEVA